MNKLSGMSRRKFLAKAAAGGTGALMSFAGPVIEKAYGAGPCSGHLSDIEHFVFFLMENRSFDHYFGTLSATDGFDSGSPLFQQKGWNPQTQTIDPAGITMPCRFDTTRGPFVDGECLSDPDHSWEAMHKSWNGGANDNWLPAQVGHSPVPNGGNVPVTMGYLTRKDIPIHYLLADTFTVCDRYFSSVLGPTLPNRLYWLSASLGADGTQGRPAADQPSDRPDRPVQLDHDAGESQRRGHQLEAVSKQDPGAGPQPVLQLHLRRHSDVLQASAGPALRVGSLRNGPHLPLRIHGRRQGQ